MTLSIRSSLASTFPPTSQVALRKMRTLRQRDERLLPLTSYVIGHNPTLTTTANLPSKDSTLTQTNSGKKFASDAQDWKWWHSTVPSILKRLYVEDGYTQFPGDSDPKCSHDCSYRVVVISNQGGISLKSDTKAPKSKLGSFKTKVSAVFNQLDIPISIYAATEKDMYRKPRTGMWSELLEDYDLHMPGDLDLENCIFVGDAGGRNASAGNPKDFSCSDRYKPVASSCSHVTNNMVGILRRMSASNFTPQKSIFSEKHRARLPVRSSNPILSQILLPKVRNTHSST